MHRHVAQVELRCQLLGCPGACIYDLLSASPFGLLTHSLSPTPYARNMYCTVPYCRKVLLQRKGVLVNMTGDERTLGLAAGGWFYSPLSLVFLFS